MLRGGDEGLVAVAVAVVDIGFLLKGGVEPAVVDSEGDEFDVLARYAAGCDGRILLLKVVCKLWAVMTAIGFREDAKVAVLVLRELCIEGLQELPDIGCSGHCGGHGIRTVAEADSNGLVDIQHVGVGVPAIWIQRWSRSAVHKVAWPVLLEEPDHA